MALHLSVAVFEHFHYNNQQPNTISQIQMTDKGVAMVTIQNSPTVIVFFIRDTTRNEKHGQEDGSWLVTSTIQNIKWRKVYSSQFQTSYGNTSSAFLPTVLMLITYFRRRRQTCQWLPTIKQGAGPIDNRTYMYMDWKCMRLQNFIRIWLLCILL